MSASDVYVSRDYADRIERERDKAEAEARYWMDAYFSHMREEHPEAVARAEARRRGEA